ncbi:MAG TPA: hypothetical protein VMW51_06795 [Terriglobia bacterium]|nr:hypothetical protein [Terriglobia bacterium]
MILFYRGSGRPLRKELLGKLRDAITLVKEGKWSPANPAKLLANWEELGQVFKIDLDLAEDQTALLLAVLGEIKPGDYAGSHPPKRSYEQKTTNQELFAFRWSSGCFSNFEMYFKFSICGGTPGQKKLYIYSLHPNREGGDQ